MRPYYAEGSKTLAYEIAEQLGWRTPDRVVARSPPARCSRRSPRASQEWLELGLIEGDRADDERRAGDGLLAGRAPRSRRARTSAARSSRTRSPSRWRSATRPTAPTRSTLARTTGGGIDAVDRRRDPRRHPPARRDDRHLHRDRRRRDDGDAREARRARRHRPRRARRRWSSPARAQDARRGARHVRRPTRSTPSFDAVRRAGRGRWCRSDGGHGEAPHPAARRRGRAGDRRRCRARRSARRSTRCSTEHGDLRDRLIDRTADLRRFVNVYVGRRGHPYAGRARDTRSATAASSPSSRPSREVEADVANSSVCGCSTVMTPMRTAG